MYKEIWKDVVGWEGLYEVSSWGRVKSTYIHPRGGKPTYGGMNKMHGENWRVVKRYIL